MPAAQFQAVAGSRHVMQEDAPEAIVGAATKFLLEVAVR
jgi:hypothetical protein